MLGGFQALALSVWNVLSVLVQNADEGDLKRSRGVNDCAPTKPACIRRIRITSKVALQGRLLTITDGGEDPLPLSSGDRLYTARGESEAEIAFAGRGNKCQSRPNCFRVINPMAIMAGVEILSRENFRPGAHLVKRNEVRGRRKQLLSASAQHAVGSPPYQTQSPVRAAVSLPG